jgi:hypothetical protein
MLTNANSVYQATIPIKISVCFARITAVSVVLPNPARSVWAAIWCIRRLRSVWPV